MQQENRSYHDAWCSGSEESWLSLQNAVGSHVDDFYRNLPAAKCSGESNLPPAYCSGESNLSAAKCSEEIWLTPAKGSGVGSPPRPLKEQSCKKSHMAEFQYPMPMRIIYENSPSLQFLFDSMLHHAVGSQTSNSRNSAIWSQKRKAFRVRFRDKGGIW
jgi:hypothetical protein